MILVTSRLHLFLGLKLCVFVTVLPEYTNVTGLESGPVSFFHSCARTRHSGTITIIDALLPKPPKRVGSALPSDERPRVPRPQDTRCKVLPSYVVKRLTWSGPPTGRYFGIFTSPDFKMYDPVWFRESFKRVWKRGVPRKVVIEFESHQGLGSFVVTIFLQFFVTCAESLLLLTPQLLCFSFVQTHPYFLYLSVLLTLHVVLRT